MKSNYKKLGTYIRQIDIRNIEAKEENLLGVSVQKKFIPSIANTVGTDFSKYKVVQKGQFTYIPDTSRRGDKIGIALLEDYDEGLVSNVYTVFEIIDEKVLIPQYLMLWFSRPEFDRFSRFKSHGSVREVFDWDEMCGVELPVPDYEEQRRIVNSYKAISDRIALKRQINDNLLAACISLYEGISQSTDNTIVTLENIASYVTKRIKFADLPVLQYLSNENLLKDKKGISGYSLCLDDESVIAFEPGDTLIGNIRPYFKKIFHCDEFGGCNADVLVIRANDIRYQELVYCALSQDSFFDYVMSGATGTKMPRGDKTHILMYEIVIPDKKSLDEFIKFSQSAIQKVRENKLEQEKLFELQQIILSRLS